MTQEITRFEVGKAYFCRSACDYDCIWTYEVVRRSDSSIWIRDLDETKAPVRRSIKIWSGVETCQPKGSYSMAPSLSADRVADLQEA